MTTILVLNGPNLDALGTRQPEIYGNTTLAQIEESLRRQAKDLDVDVQLVQSADLDVLLQVIAAGGFDGIVVNPAAFTHFSYPLAEALAGSNVPVVEVHLSNIHAREHFRRLSVISPVARGVIAGLGAEGYGYALDACTRMIRQL